jgi:transcriptional antiterminator NusG
MWYVIQTLSGDEFRMQNLCRARIDAGAYHDIFVPQSITKKHYRREWHDVKKVLFPGYVFVDTDQIEEIAKKLNEINGFTRILRCGDEIVPVSRQERKFLEGLMDDDHTVRYSLGIIIGKKVCITEGALKNRSGLIRKVDRHRRIAVLDVNFFGRPTPVEVGFGAFARVTEEEWEKIRQENICRFEKEKQEKQPADPALVRILSGAFAGMSGSLVSENPTKDEYTVEVKIFDRPTKAVFARSELEKVSSSEN